MKINSLKKQNGQVSANFNNGAGAGSTMSITPETYIEELKNLRQFTRWTNRRIDEAIDEMEGRLETGYEFKEDKSKMAVKTALEHTQTMVDILNKLLTCHIEY